MQTDLNEEFGLYLLSDQTLAKISGGLIDSTPSASRTAASARWAARNKGALFDRSGKHNFGPGGTYFQAMEAIAAPFIIDPGAEVLKSARQASMASEFMAFYASSQAANIPPSITLVGISVPMGPQLLPALLLAEYIKLTKPKTRIVLGGPTLSLMDETDIATLLLSNSAVDCVVRFDGEEPLLDLAKQADSSSWNLADTGGVCYAEFDSVVFVPPRPGKNLNVLPVPHYPQESIARLAKPSLSITQARGCYWGKCDYCDFIELYDGSPPFRGRHPSNFVDELDHLHSEFGIRDYYFVTESIPPAFARKASRLIIDRGLDVRWTSFAMVDRRFDMDLFALMAEAGCDHLVIGLETMNTRVLKLVHKSADNAENVRFLRQAHAAGVNLSVNLIPDLPTTTFDEALEALQRIEDLSACLYGVSVFPFEPTRSSNIGRNPERFGLMPNPEGRDTGIAQYALNHLNSRDPAMSVEERAEVYRRYHEFARRINKRLGPSQEPPNYHVEAVRLAVEQLDIFDQGADLLCTHMTTSKRFFIRGIEASVVMHYRDGTPFDLETLSDRLGPQAAERLMYKLSSAQMLERSGAI